MVQYEGDKLKTQVVTFNSQTLDFGKGFYPFHRSDYKLKVHKKALYSPDYNCAEAVVVQYMVSSL